VDAAQLIRLAISASIVLLVLGLGLRAAPADATYLLRRPTLLLPALLAMYVVVPSAAAALAGLFDLPLAVEVALLAMAVSPVPPILPGKQLRLGGRTSYVYGLLVAAAVAAIVLVPLAVEVLGWVFRREVHIGVLVVAKLLGVTVLLPLGAGLAVRHLAPALAERAATWASRLGTVLLVAGLLPTLVAVWPGIVVLVGTGAVLAIAAVVAAGLAAGHWLGGPEPGDRTALAIAASMRHPGVALAIAGINFPAERLVPATVLLFLLVNLVLTVPYGARRKRLREG
jgi:BASS family bile acid:Na+ symporter